MCWGISMKTICILALSLVLFAGTIHANPFLKQIIDDCENDGSIKSVGFGEISNNPSKADGESSYKLDGPYKEGRFNLIEHKVKDKNYSILWFYSSIQKRKKGEDHSEIWHLLITPSEIQNKHKTRGYINPSTMSEAVK